MPSSSTLSISSDQPISGSEVAEDDGGDGHPARHDNGSQQRTKRKRSEKRSGHDVEATDEPAKKKCNKRDTGSWELAKPKHRGKMSGVDGKKSSMQKTNGTTKQNRKTKLLVDKTVTGDSVRRKTGSPLPLRAQSAR